VPNVPIDVLLVKSIPITVSLVLLTELEFTIAHVLLVCMKMNKNNVNLVHLIVLLVLMLILVSLVQLTLTDLHLLNVHVSLDIMKLKVFVMLVTSDV